MKKVIVLLACLALTGCGEILPPGGLNLDLNIKPNQEQDTQLSENLASGNLNAQDLQALLQSFVEKSEARNRGGQSTAAQQADFEANWTAPEEDEYLSEEDVRPEDHESRDAEDFAEFPQNFAEAHFADEHFASGPEYEGFVYGELPRIDLPDNYVPGTYPVHMNGCGGDFSTASENEAQPESLSLKSEYIRITEIISEQAELYSEPELQARFAHETAQILPEDPLFLEAFSDESHPMLLIRADLLERVNMSRDDLEALLHDQIQNYLQQDSCVVSNA